MSEFEINSETNPLIIIENEIPPNISESDKSDDNKSTGELFDFSDIGEFEESARLNCLLKIEEKDLEMDAVEDQNNNNSSNNPRLSLHVTSDDESSSGLTNEAINRTIIRNGSNDSSYDYGEAESRVEQPHEAINHELGDSAREKYPDDEEGIVNILGQIDILVGFTEIVLNVSCCGNSVQRGSTW